MRDTFDLKTFRGVFSFDLNQTVLLVKAPPDSVAEAFAALDGGTVTKDVYGVEVTLTKDCYDVCRIAGHAWTSIQERFANVFQGYGLHPEWAQTLSKQLACPVFFYGNSDTAGCLEYTLYESGQQIEHMDYGLEQEDFDPEGVDVEDFDLEDFDGDDLEGEDRPRFESTTRTLSADAIDDPYDFANNTLASHDAAVPAWCPRFFKDVSGQKDAFTLENSPFGEDTAAFEAFHFVAFARK